MSKTHYDILGLDENASSKDIKKAYRQLSLKYHPDHNTNSDAHEMMTKVNEAYNILGDAEKRKEYDDERNGKIPTMPNIFGNTRTNTTTHTMNGFTPEMSEMFNNIFGNQMFNSMGGNSNANIHFFQTGGNGGGTFHRVFQQQQQQKPSPIEIQITLNIYECYTGKEVTVNFPRWTIMNNTKVTENTKIVVNIPPGVSENDKITFEKQGHSINENLKGDIIVKFIVINNTEFKRIGNDLHIKRTITLKDALCGFSTTFTHLNGKTMSMKNVSKNNGVIVTPGYKKIASGLGMNTSNGVGNLVIEFEIEFPKTLSDEQIDEISKNLE